MNRLNGEVGFCKVKEKAVVYKYKLHHGEEPPISGRRGSGIIFFSGCTLGCVFCQNYPMSHWRRGREISIPQLAKIMLALQRSGAHNLNLVTASHFVPQILLALEAAIDEGFSLPIVYNSSGYETIETLELLDGVVDVYLPDMKYSQGKIAKKYSGARDYHEFNQAAVREMYRQVGDLILDENEIAVRGLIIRHLLLPNGLAGTEEIMRFIAEEVSVRIHISLMSQYLPIWGAKDYPEIRRRIEMREYEEALNILARYGLDNGWVQEFS